jgi:tryptophan 2,3-dioxygenase
MRCSDEVKDVIVDRYAQTEYASYLALDEILSAQRPRSDLHDEMVFVVAHQVHELWFKQLLVEFTALQRQLAGCATAPALHTLHRTLNIISAMAGPIDVLATLEPLQFHGFRPKLGSASGFQSAQFREIEAVLGRRDPRMVRYFPRGGGERARIEAAMGRPCVFDSFLRYLAGEGYPVPGDRLHRDASQPLEPSPAVQEVLLRVYLDNGFAAQVSERLVEVDQGIQEWRYRHLSLAERLLGGKPGTAGSSGTSYLRRTLARPVFPDLWAVRCAL